MHSTCLVRVPSWQAKQTKNMLQTFLKLVAVSSMHMSQDVRRLDEKPVHFGISIHLQLGEARRERGKRLHLKQKYKNTWGSFKYSKALINTGSSRLCKTLVEFVKNLVKI